ncbi:carbohydrate ABC transporter substrate-binding protein [Salinibacterium sp. SWN139]|uniref:ABC transporter substrate-binding protein n=1 Tax=Salinibacterium sp. SWN139 TaxID=2792055 RepID=UPI0018CF5925|nr:ABC transporter substrate-binding protein [Salinibacterium sp. SWN139]MBH0052862.1 carbohydrate ABC transporter substrate-binding protein [Salinibacterium sp. SWN139]
MKTKRFLSASAGVAIISAAALVLSGCSADGGATAPEQTDSGGKITVWVDPPRVPAAEAFQEAHPEIEIDVVQIDGTVGGQTVKQAFANFDSAGSGWPDAIFFPSNDDIAWATGAASNYAADLTDLLPDVIDGYDPAVLSFCDIDGQIRCLRNDAAPDVFWYNKAFFDENGYTLPTTWEGYGDLAVQIAAEHPDKISGFLGDAYAVNRYLQAADCPTNDRLSESEVHINLDDPNCVRANELLTQMYDGGALTTQGIFDGDAAAAGVNMVMSPGAVWWGNYLFRDTWKIPAGEMSASAPLTWEGESSPTAGNEGGGLWGVSSHITGKQLENTLTFATFVATDPAWQVELSTGLPGYGPIQDAWLEKLEADGYFADVASVQQAFKDAAGAVAPYSYMLYDTGAAWTETVSPTLIADGSISDALSTFGTELVNRADSVGYTVTAE